MKKIMIVFGTRPEAIKMAPLVNELKSRERMEVVLCVTGQHREMLKQVLKTFKLQPDYNLDIMTNGQDLYDVTTAVMQKIKPVLEKEAPDIVLVHGDTTTTFATALSAYYKGISVGHVEAGLRTYNIYSPYPEEFNRQSVSILAEYNFAPTEWARDNLVREGKDEEKVFVTGNTVIDALSTTVREDYNHELLNWLGQDRLLLITAHRRENLGETMKGMFRAIKRILDEYDDVKAIYPVHMNPIVRNTADEVFGRCESIKLIEPLDIIDFHNFMGRSYLVLTDSGGIQEEAPSLGKPVLVMRDTTERPEGIKAGTLKLVGTNEETIYEQTKMLLDNPSEYGKISKRNNPYGDGKASIRISNILEEVLV